MDKNYEKKRNLYCLASLLLIATTILFIFLGEDFGLGYDFENTFLNPVLLPLSLSLWLIIIGIFLRKKIRQPDFALHSNICGSARNLYSNWNRF